MNALVLAIAIFTPEETADIRVMLETMYSLVEVVRNDWDNIDVDRVAASARMKHLTVALYDVNDGLSYLLNYKKDGPRPNTVTKGLARIRVDAVSKLDAAIARGARVATQRAALANIPTRPYLTWRPANYPAVFGTSGNWDSFVTGSAKGSEAYFHLYWDAVNWATPGVVPAWTAQATDECKQSVNYLRDVGLYMVRARGVTLGVPIKGDQGTWQELVQLLLQNVMSRYVDLQIAEYGKAGCFGTLASFNGGIWTLEQMNWRAPKAIGVPDVDNRGAEWFSDWMETMDMGPWVAAALTPSMQAEP